MNELLRAVSAALTRHQYRLITAESCTGGLIASDITAIPGSSDWFEGAFVTYQPRSKVRLLGVEPATIERYSVVSEPVAREMALGALTHSDADVSVAVTGVAGPGGGDIMTPVGTVWFAWALKHPETHFVHAVETEYHGERAEVRELAVRTALEGVLDTLR